MMALLKFIGFITLSHGGTGINKGVCHFDVTCGPLQRSGSSCGTFMWLGGTLKKFFQHVKKKQKDFQLIKYDDWLFACVKLAGVVCL